MRQAIVTKYIGPTNTRPGRVKATCDAATKTFDWNHAWNVERNHTEAARKLADSLSWYGTWSGGAMPGAGYAFVLTDDLYARFDIEPRDKA